ncbi:pur operon repressor [Facklamia miroungae]|uniref:Purine operon repressor n=1 Tax=Facklamia miroungae TaxID=120956 RepID=A0A1G7SI19_9LACT|nr:pur operon repressor [Facklamia miroungae]NKZ29645.1 pur operon repressor [Facklamia miroungae]SDG22648.1 purine operon repressor [Facklamia miroungae]
MQMNKKYKRNQRLIAITHQLMNKPNQLINLQDFASRFQCAKSSVSEDLAMVRMVFDEMQLGQLETLTGKTGGVIFRPQLSEEEIIAIQTQVKERLSEGKRILPGNYIFVNDLLQDPSVLNPIAQLIAAKYAEKEIDTILTIESKGIGLAAAVALYLNKPYVVVRRESTSGEGSTISINYTSGSTQTVKKMELSKSALKSHSRVLIVDDFLRNGGTLTGLLNLIEEFDSKAAGICVFAENKVKNRMNIPNYHALFETQLRYNNQLGHYQLEIEAGNFFN